MNFTRWLSAATAAALLLGTAAVAQAQGLDEALRLYKRRDYPEAVVNFYSVMANDSNPENREQAEIYLAETLRKMELYASALYYYSHMIGEFGAQSRYFLNAVEGILDLQKEMRDPVFVPILITNSVATNQEAFAQLDPDRIAHINFIVGESSLRQGRLNLAKSFLSYVPPESSYYANSQYLMAVLEIQQKNPKGALEILEGILDTIDEDTGNERRKHLREMTLIAAGRTAYGLGRFQRASSYYKLVPRFSNNWFTAMYENAWALFQRGEYGRSLGELTSVMSPYFSRRHVPEAQVVKGTTYFANCQWDRVRGTVTDFNEKYVPMAQELEAYIAGSAAQPDLVYEDMVKDGGGRIAKELAVTVRRTQRFRDLHFVIEHMSWELKDGIRQGALGNSRFQKDMGAYLDSEYLQPLRRAAGQYALNRLRNGRLRDLKNFQRQIDLLDLEVTDAERQWLEQGKEILHGRRARLPRPEIPNDQWQHWNFEREYWKDELGYIQHSLACECLSKEECEVLKENM